MVDNGNAGGVQTWEINWIMTWRHACPSATGGLHTLPTTIRRSSTWRARGLVRADQLHAMNRQPTAPAQGQPESGPEHRGDMAARLLNEFF